MRHLIFDAADAGGAGRLNPDFHRDGKARRRLSLPVRSHSPIQALLLGLANAKRRIPNDMLNEPIRILLVDDHAIVREGVMALCEGAEGLQVVGEAGDGDAALALLAHVAVDVALVDLKMPGMPSAELVERIKAGWPKCRVIIFTSYADDQALIEVTQAGADGYLLKDVQRQELISAIRAVAAGQPWLHQAMHAQLLGLIRRKPSADPYAQLSARDRSVLRLLGQGLSNRQIAEQLALTEGTVKGYVSALLRKLHLEQRTQAALLVARHPLAQSE